MSTTQGLTSPLIKGETRESYTSDTGSTHEDLNMLDEKPDCERCKGCGQVASFNHELAWSEATTYFMADIAMQAGFIVPVTCPDCAGTGKKGENDHKGPDQLAQT